MLANNDLTLQLIKNYTSNLTFKNAINFYATCIQLIYHYLLFM